MSILPVSNTNLMNRSCGTPGTISAAASVPLEAGAVAGLTGGEGGELEGAGGGVPSALLATTPPPIDPARPLPLKVEARLASTALLASYKSQSCHPL